MEFCCVNSPVGILTLREEKGTLTALDFTPQAELKAPATQLLRMAVTQLDEYFAGIRKSFDVLLRLDGTEFQCRVWEALLDIPWGETRSYGQIAATIGNPKASRAVGMANNRNPVSIIVPCHRVVGSDGRLLGYGGGLDVKKKLLTLEVMR